MLAQSVATILHSFHIFYHTFVAMTSLKFLRLILAVFLTVQFINAVPVQKRNKAKAKAAKATTLTGEHPTKKLPKGTPQVHGLATNWTWTDKQFKPSFLAKASINNDVFSVSSNQISTLQNFAHLASTGYCNVGSVGSQFSCASYCSDFPSTTVVTTFKTSAYDTVGFVARDDANQLIYVVYSGSSQPAQFIQDFKFIKTNYPPVSGAQVHLGESIS